MTNMNEITYSETEPKPAMSFVFFARCSIVVALMFSVGPAIDLFSNGTIPLVDWLDWLQVGLPAVWWIFAGFEALELASWRRNRDRYRYRLAADQNGLTYANDRITWHWHWRDLSPFEHVSNHWWHDEHIRFRTKSRKWKDNRHGIFDLGATVARRIAFAGKGWEFYLLDSFDRPLAEIAAELNDLRERALDGPVET